MRTMIMGPIPAGATQAINKHIGVAADESLPANMVLGGQ